MDLVNNDGKTCYEVCFTEGGREICESFGYSYVTKEDRAAKREREQMEAAKRAEAEQVELKMKKLEMMRSTNSMNRREHAKPTDDFPGKPYLCLVLASSFSPNHDFPGKPTFALFFLLCSSFPFLIMRAASEPHCVCRGFFPPGDQAGRQQGTSLVLRG